MSSFKKVSMESLAHVSLEKVSSALTEFKAGNGKTFHISGLWGSSRAYISHLIAQSWDGFILYIAPTVNEAERFYNDLDLISMSNWLFGMAQRMNNLMKNRMCHYSPKPLRAVMPKSGDTVPPVGTH